MLNTFGNLTTLRFSDNPLTCSMGVNETRQLVISRIASLLKFNASQVRPRERQEAEKMCLKRICAEVLLGMKNENTSTISSTHSAQLLVTYPRYPEFQVLYKEDMERFMNIRSHGNNDRSGNSTIGSSLISVELLSMAIESMTLEPIIKKLPMSYVNYKK